MLLKTLRTWRWPMTCLIIAISLLIVNEFWDKVVVVIFPPTNQYPVGQMGEVLTGGEVLRITRTSSDCSEITVWGADADPFVLKVAGIWVKVQHNGQYSHSFSVTTDASESFTILSGSSLLSIHAACSHGNLFVEDWASPPVLIIHMIILAFSACFIFSVAIAYADTVALRKKN